MPHGRHSGDRDFSPKQIFLVNSSPSSSHWLALRNLELTLLASLCVCGSAQHRPDGPERWERRPERRGLPLSGRQHRGRGTPRLRDKEKQHVRVSSHFLEFQDAHRAALFPGTQLLLQGFHSAATNSISKTVVNDTAHKCATAAWKRAVA